MNDAFKRRLVGLLTLAALALLLSWLLPRPGLRKLEGSDERVAAMDLTKPGSPAQEILPEPPEPARAEAPRPKGAEGSTLFPLPADPNAPGLDAAAEEEPAPDAEAPDQPPPAPPSDKAVAETLAAERAAAEKAAFEKANAAKASADRATADKVATEKAAAEKARADKAAADQAAAERIAAQKAAAEKAAAEQAVIAKTAEKPAAPPVTVASTAPVKPATATPPAATTATPPKPGTTTAATTAPSPPKPSANGTWYAQCGVYSLLSNAQSLRDELAARGMNCDMTPFENDKGTSYRVRCGPFKSRGEAEIVVSRISDRVKAIVVDGAR